MHNRRRTAVLATALAGALLAGCGSGDGGDAGTGTGGRGAGGTPAPVRLSTPVAYDGAKGWDQEIDWVQNNAFAFEEPVATDGTTVAYILRSGAGYRVQARDGVTGRVRWTSAPYQTPPVNPSTTYTAEVPRLTTVRQGGRTYVAAWAVGEQTGDALATTEQVAQVNVYAMDGSGSSVAPLHTVSLPVDTRADPAVVRDGGNGLLVTWTWKGNNAAIIDMPTGRVTQYHEAQAPLKVGDTVQAVTLKGPLLQRLSGGLTVPGGWTGKDVAPKGADIQSGTVVGVRDGKFLAYWRQADDSGDSKDRIWTLHDLESGRVLASTMCEGVQSDTSPLVVSPDGARLAFGEVTLDAKTGKGVCLAGDDTRRPVEVVALSDEGTAYGVTDAYRSVDADAAISSKPAVEVDLSSGMAKGLPSGTIAPAATLKGGAVFTLRENGAGLRLSVRERRH